MSSAEKEKAALARTLGQTCQLSDSLALCEVVLQAGEAHGLWVTARYIDSRADTGGSNSQALTQRRPSATAVASQRRIADGTSSLAYRRHWLVVDHRLPGGDGMPQVARALSDLAFVYRRLGVYVVAIKLQEEAASMLQAIHEGGQHPDLANSLSELGCCHYAVGRFGAALHMHTEALEMRQELAKLGSVPTADVVSSMHRLAMVHMIMGAMHTAERLCRRGLAMATSDGHTSLRESVAHCIYGLARVLHRTGRMLEAQAVFREALHGFCTIHGKMDHRDVAACQTSLADLLSEYTDVEAAAEAERCFKAAIAMYERMLGSLAHPDVAHAQRGLGLLYRRLGREAEASVLLSTARTMDAAVFGAEGMADRLRVKTVSAATVPAAHLPRAKSSPALAASGASQGSGIDESH